jgi:hypothetical protein
MGYLESCPEHGTAHIQWGVCYHPIHLQRVIDRFDETVLIPAPIRDIWSGNPDTDKAWRYIR